MTRKLIIAAAGLLAALALNASTPVKAQTQVQVWPSRTVTIVVPFPPGAASTCWRVSRRSGCRQA